MFGKTFTPYRKRLNSQILTKAEIALEAIKKHDLQQSRTKFHNHSKNNEQILLNFLEKDYSRLMIPKQLQLDKTYSINLLAHTQQFYVLSMANHVFPVRVFIKNVKNSGILYVGYDCQYPGVSSQCKDIKIQSGISQNQKNYDYKALINKEILITLKNKENKQVQQIYFTIDSGPSLLMFNFKLQTLNFQKDKSFSIQKDGELKMLPSKSDKEIPKLTRQRTEPIQTFKTLQRLNLFPEISQSRKKIIKFQQNQARQKLIFTKSTNLQQMEKGLLKIDKSDRKEFIKEDKLASKNSLQRSDLKFQQIKRNKYLLQVYKQKNRQLRETASKCKQLIQGYKKSYNEQNVRKRKLNYILIQTLYSAIFIGKIHHQYAIKSRQLSIQKKIYYLCKKFIRKLKTKHKQSEKMIFYRSNRSKVEVINAIDLQSKLIRKQSQNKAENIIKETFNSLMVTLSINKALRQSNSYNEKIKIIQRTWKTKYYSRISCLLYFVDNHVEKMLKQYPHLKLFHEQFYKARANRQICLNYIKDQSQKYRYIYDAYVKRLQQLNEMIEVNKKDISKKSSKKQKFALNSKEPLRPMHRFYRNCDILKSMVRTWFQLEYKKYFKKLAGIYKK